MKLEDIGFYTLSDERIKEERNKTAKIIVARLLGSLEATPLNISMIETLLVEYEIKIARVAERLAKIEALEEVRIKITLLDTIVPDNVVFSHYMQGQVDLNKEALKAIDSMIAELKEEGE